MFARALPEDARAFGHRLGSRVLDSRSSFGLQGSPLLWSRVELESAQIMANTAAREQVACKSTGLSTVVDNGCVPSPLAQERIHRLRGEVPRLRSALGSWTRDRAIVSVRVRRASRGKLRLGQKGWGTNAVTWKNGARLYCPSI